MARRGAGRRNRRVVDVARAPQITSNALGITPLAFDVLTPYLLDAGLSRHPAGITIVGLRYTFDVGLTTPASFGRQQWWYGFLVGPVGLTSTALDPFGNQHADWMEWGCAFGSDNRGAQASIRWPPGGDDGFRTVRSKRRMNELEDNLYFAIVAATSGPWSFALNVSVHFALP